MKSKPIRKLAFWPVFILLGGAILLNFINEEAFINMFTILNNLFMSKLGWLASLVAVGCVILCFWVMFSEFGDVKIGGKNAKPKLSNFSWFSISLTSTLASGILIWGAAEPIFHMMNPATEITGILPGSGDSAKFAMETMYMHWSFVPYAIMTSAAIVFSFMYYNGEQSYSVSTQLSPMLGKHNSKTVSEIIDGLVLFCITVAIAASMGQMLLNINSGIAHVTGMKTNNFTMLMICVICSAIYIGTAITGIEKGIKICADVNVYLYIAFLASFIVLGPVSFFLNLGTEAFGGFLTNFFDHALMTGAAHNSQWPQSWTTFYWASYFSWTPTLGLFLGSIAYGRTIRSMVALNFGLNGGFGLIWMTLISGTAIERQLHGTLDLINSLTVKGVGGVPYDVISSLPGGMAISVLYLVVLIITFVTAVNANVSVMGSLSVEGVSMEDPNGSPAYQKVIWGIIVAAISYIMTALIGIDGVKALSNIGGIVAIFIELGIMASIVILIRNWRKFDKTKTYYQEKPELEEV